MNQRIEEAFQRAEADGRCAFIPYHTGGFPDPEGCLEFLTVLDQCGADLVEVGIPFSDPLADGPVIQRSSQEALQAGATPQMVLEIVSEARKVIRAPIVIMTYWNPVLRMGADNFASKAAEAGIAGVIVPDLPPEEAGDWIRASEAHGLASIFMATNTTPHKRMEMLISITTGFLYYVSLTGVTGSALTLNDGLLRNVQRIRSSASIPVAVGFGIATAKDAAFIAKAADGIIVGSALIRQILAHRERSAQIEAVRRLATSISRALIR